MPDAIFADPRLAAVYDPLDPDRSDLDAYVAMVAEFAATSVLDIGCGTGTLACRLAGLGAGVVAVDPAAASLAVARGKPGAERVRWLHGTAERLPPLTVDLAVMTGNVAQVFVTDGAWRRTLAGLRRAVRPGGRFVFESRDPQRRPWLRWTRAATCRRAKVPGIGAVQAWEELTGVDGALVSFRTSVAFERDGQVLTSTSTLRFRGRAELVDSLTAAGFRVEEIRDAPDRPGLEFVVLARPVA
jgi:SAM-dependent methyltransferase